MSVETSVSITAGTNLGVSTLGAITAPIRQYHQKNIEFRAFIFLATTGVAAFIGSFFTSYVPITILLIIIGLIVAYESFALLNGSRIKKKRLINNNSQLDEIANNDRIVVRARIN